MMANDIEFITFTFFSFSIIIYLVSSLRQKDRDYEELNNKVIAMDKEIETLFEESEAHDNLIKHIARKIPFSGEQWQQELNKEAFKNQLDYGNYVIIDGVYKSTFTDDENINNFIDESNKEK